MFTGFSLEGLKSDFFCVDKNKYTYDEYKKTGEALFDEYKTSVNELRKTYEKNGRLDGRMMEADWFPKVNADVFLSHSHGDRCKTLALAGWLSKKCGVRAFVDSAIWGLADDLLKELDDEYCRKKDGKRYDYRKRNVTTSHVHMMLNTALTKMIDKCECLIFVNTPKSIVLSEEVGVEKDEKKTLSPWIYSELAFSGMVKRMPPRCDYLMHSEEGALMESARSKLEIEYTVNTKHLHKLSTKDLSEWASVASLNFPERSLPKLYEQMQIPEWTEWKSRVSGGV